MKKHFKRLLSFGVTLSIILGTIITPTASDVQVTVSNNPKIDIMLTSKITNYDLSKFEQDVRANLQGKGVNTSNIAFQTVKRDFISTDQSSASEIFADWACFIAGNNVNSTNGTAYYGPGNTHVDNIQSLYGSQIGKTTTASTYYQVINNRVQMIKNSVRPAVAFYDPASLDTQNATISFNYGIDATNYESFTDGEAGFIFKVQDPLNYYVYVMDNHDLCGNAGYTYREVLLKSVNGVWYYIDSKELPAYSAGMLWNIKIELEGNNIKIYREGNLRFEYEDNTTLGNGKLYSTGSYGFYVWHQKGAYFSNISVDKESFKTFKNVLTEPTWREDAKHVIVNVDNNIDDTLTSTATIGEVLSRTLADDIHFIQWGSDTNKSASLNFIKQNDNKGLFTQSSNYNQAVEDTATYIKGLIEQESSEQYITIGQDIDLTVTPSNLKTNATSTDYPNGRWKINHNYKHFTNNLGQSAESGMYAPNLVCSFDKPGEYEILFDDELVKTIYVHRKPVADFEINFNRTNLTLESTAYDLDSNKNNGNGVGIAKETWYYKEASASEWTMGKLTALDKSKIYVIKLEVEDFQGATSYTTKYVGTGNPVAKFNFANDTVCKFNKLEINNTSYDPVGYEIKTESWELKKDGKLVGTYSTPILDFNTTDLGPGNYTYTLVVTNSQTTKSEAYTKSFTIVDDISKPEIAIEVEVDNTWLPEKEVDIEVSDNESNVSKWRYEFVTSPTPTSINDDWSNWETEKTEMTINSGTLSGRYYLHIQAYDSANNLTERTVGPFNLDNTNPVINGVDVEKQGFRETKVTIDAFDEHSGIVGYALTKYETATYSARTFAAVETPEFQDSNEFMVDEDGLYTAWAIDELGNIETSVCEVTNSNQTDKTTTVYAEIGSEFKVTIPKKIVLDGATKSGTYTVTVEGDIAGLEVINVTPDSAVTLSSKDKADVIGTITQDKLNWTYSEIYTDSKILANGSISASGITAGAWNGTFNFAIKLENNGKYTNSEWSVEYQDVTFDMEELDNSEVTEPTE